MEAAKPNPEDTLSVSSENEEELARHDRMKSPRDEEMIAVEKELSSYQDIEVPIELENEDSVAVKYDSFRVEETNSPLPLSPITEVSPDAEAPPRPDSDMQRLFTSSELPVNATIADTLDKELDDLLKFSESSSAANIPQPVAVATSSQNEDLTPSDAIVTPPPMFDSPPPPKPKTEAPKRVVKRPAPPPPKPKPKTVATPTEPELEQDAETKSVDSKDSTGLISDNPFRQSPKRSESPDLVTQMQALAYSKSITSSTDWAVTKPQGTSQPAQSENTSSSPSRYSQREQTLQEKKTSSLPRNIASRVNQSPYYPNQSAKPQSLGISSNEFNSTPGTSPYHTTPLESTTPKLVEVMGDIKIQHVMKTRWRPKSTSADSQTPEHQPPPANHSKAERSATLPNIYNGYMNGAPKGIGSGISRPGQTLPRFQPIPVKGNPYQQNLQQQQQPWKSQEELRANYVQQKARPRMASTPDGTQEYRIHKSMSLPRGSLDSTRNGRANTWSANKVGGPVTLDGYQVVYATQPSSPHDLCSRCHQPLGQGTVLALPSLKTVYHVKCFVCRVCRGPLTQGGQSTSVMIKNRQPHCRYCISGENGKNTLRS